MSEPMHEFIARRRSEVLANCVQRMKTSMPAWSEADLEGGFGAVVDDVLAALQHEAGLPVTSQLPGRSEAALRHGGSRQSHGYPIAKVATDFGSVSDVLGQLASEEGLTFSAREYQVLNQSLDTAIASALDQFWTQSREQLATSEQERMGFLAHELRNALGSARVAFSILRGGQLTALSRTGDVLDRSLSRLERLIEQALTAVRLQGRLELTLERVPVPSFLRELAEAAVIERGITIRVEAAPELALTADEKLLHSAVGNLLHNAVKFTKPGGEIVMRASADAGSVVIEIEDQCGGLPPGNEDELFKPFIQKGTNRRGVGLGLTITKDAVEAHEGELSVRNLPGRGCVFCVRLRAHR